MEGGMWGLIGGGIGATIGVLGAAWGTSRSIRSCGTPEARRFMIRFSVALWAGMSLGMLVIVLHVFRLVPDWAYWVAMACMLGAIVPLARFVNSRMAVLDPPRTSGDAAS